MIDSVHPLTCPSVAGIAACDQSYSIQSGIGALVRRGWCLDSELDELDLLICLLWIESLFPLVTGSLICHFSISYSPWKANRNWGWSTSLKSAIAHHCSKHVVLFALGNVDSRCPNRTSQKAKRRGSPSSGGLRTSEPGLTSLDPSAVSRLQMLLEQGKVATPLRCGYEHRRQGRHLSVRAPKNRPVMRDGKDGTSQPWHGIWKLKQSWVLGCKWSD